MEQRESIKKVGGTVTEQWEGRRDSDREWTRQEQGIVAEQSNWWWNSGRAVKRMVEQWQSMEKIGGTGRTIAEQWEGRWNNGRAWKISEEHWQSSENEGGTLAEHGKDWRNCGRAVRRKVKQWESLERL
jgi:hypothetical protein